MRSAIVRGSDPEPSRLPDPSLVLHSRNCTAPLPTSFDTDPSASPVPQKLHQQPSLRRTGEHPVGHWTLSASCRVTQAAATQPGWGTGTVRGKGNAGRGACARALSVRLTALHFGSSATCPGAPTRKLAMCIKTDLSLLRAFAWRRAGAAPVALLVQPVESANCGCFLAHPRF